MGTANGTARCWVVGCARPGCEELPGISVIGSIPPQVRLATRRVWHFFNELMPDPFPADVHQFLRDHIRSVAQLEVLLLLHTDDQKAWTIEESAKQLYIASSMTGPLLESLRDSGLVVVDDGNSKRYRFSPKTAELRQVVGDLARMYHERPVSTINIIYAIPTENLQSFADAFRIRKKEDE
jgi:hypothetical protein